MKKFKIFLSFLTVAMICVMVSCGGKNPADEYVDMLNQATEKIEKINSLEEILKVNEIIQPDVWNEFINQHADYELSDKDRQKIKDAFDKLAEVSFEKTIKLSNLPEEVVKDAQDQFDMVMKQANDKMENAKTLGEMVGSTPAL